MKEFFISSPDDERVADFIGLSNQVPSLVVQ